MASGFGILLVLIGSFLIVVGFQTISECSNRIPYLNCWDPSQEPGGLQYGYSGSILTLGFYVGSLMVTIGAVILLQGIIGRLLGKLRGS